MEGWIKVHRKLIEWEWYQDSNMVHLFIHLLLSANHSKGKWRGIDVDRGQLITGRNRLSDKTGISPQSIRTCLEKLKSTQEITIKPTNKFSLITVCNYDDYQLKESDINQQTNQQLTINQPTTNQQLTTNKNVNNVNNEKEVKTRVRKSLMRNNEGLFTRVKESFLKTQDLKNADALYYFNICLDWSDSKNEMRTDWVATVRGFARRDLKDGKMKVSSFVQVGGSNLSIKEPEPEPEPIKRGPVITREEWLASPEYKQKFKKS